MTEAAREWTPEEIRWIVSNGIKMTGMPAFGQHHSPEEIVALTAFVSALPGLLRGVSPKCVPTTPVTCGFGDANQPDYPISR